MAYKAVTVRLREDDLSRLDALARYFAESGELGVFMDTGSKITRSDMIRTCVAGWLMDHHAVVEKMLSEASP